MAEYIEREAALRVAHIMRPEDKRLKAEMANIPAADVAPVVRCKDCKWANLCNLGQRLGLNGFCSEGERKDT
nr:MAG TPA: hypothetical protein [Caudoviricetes sp.]